MTPEEFRKAGYRIIDWIADYRAGIESRPVMAKSSPGDIIAQLPASPPQQPESFDAIISDLDRIVLPGITTWQHPRFFGYFPAGGDLSSMLGDYVSTGLGVVGLAWQSSPALTEVEEVTASWMRQMFGLSGAWSGVINDTASTGTLVALICARERASDYSLARGGLQDGAQPLVVYVSSQSHSSVEKAALLAGFGKAHVRSVPIDGAYAMRADALEELVKDDLANGRKPCAVVATAGTTTTTAFDPLDAIARIAEAHGLW
jgi:aromatic-L-amino-acid decarboxylase